MFLQDTPIPKQSSALIIAHEKRILSSLGILGPFRLQSLHLIDGPVTRWSTVLKSASGTKYEANFDDGSGKLESLRDISAPTDGPISPPREAVPDAVLDRWLSACAPGFVTRFDGACAQKKGFATATYSILVHGHPFLAPAVIGFRFSYATVDHRFLSFWADTHIPPVDPRPPTITASQAFGIFVRYRAELQNRESRVSSYGKHVLPPTYGTPGPARLGYSLRWNEKVARLVWEIPLYVPPSRSSMAHTPATVSPPTRRIQAGSFLIDAVTSEIVTKAY